MFLLHTHTHTHSLKKNPTRKKTTTGSIRRALRELDEKTKSVILVNVRSFGTEHRQSATPIRPQAKLYPIIKFENENIAQIEVLSLVLPRFLSNNMDILLRMRMPLVCPHNSNSKECRRMRNSILTVDMVDMDKCLTSSNESSMERVLRATTTTTTTTMDGSERRTISRWFQRSSWSSPNDELDSEYNDEYDENPELGLPDVLHRPPQPNQQLPVRLRLLLLLNRQRLLLQVFGTNLLHIPQTRNQRARLGAKQQRRFRRTSPHGIK